MFVCFGARDAAITARGRVLIRQAASLAVWVVFGKANVRQSAKYKGKCSFFYDVWGAYRTEDIYVPHESFLLAMQLLQSPTREIMHKYYDL